MSVTSNPFIPSQSTNSLTLAEAAKLRSWCWDEVKTWTREERGRWWEGPKVSHPPIEEHQELAHVLFMWLIQPKLRWLDKMVEADLYGDDQS